MNHCPNCGKPTRAWILCSTGWACVNCAGDKRLAKRNDRKIGVTIFDSDMIAEQIRLSQYEAEYEIAHAACLERVSKVIC